MSVEPVNVFEAAARLYQPFHLVPLARVGDFVAMVFICQGAIAWHKHEDLDELFLVQTGEIVLESESGTLTLTPGQLAVAPRQVPHRSRADTRSVVLLFERTTLASVRNGHRRVFISGAEAPFAKVDLAQVAHRLTTPFQPTPIADINEFTAWLCRADGLSPRWRHLAHQVLVFVSEGQVALEIENEAVSLNHGDLAVVPCGTPHRLYAPAEAHLLLFANNHLELRTGSP
jgi:mannose-6-phosphate isomerase-like protein (cupin superfamily)